MITLNQWLSHVQEMIKKNPKIGNYPLIYSIDDEGSDYHKVISTPTLVQVHVINEYFLEIVGFQEDTDIAEEDCNAICIN